MRIQRTPDIIVMLICEIGNGIRIGTVSADVRARARSSSFCIGGFLASLRVRQPSFQHLMFNHATTPNAKYAWPSKVLF